MINGNQIIADDEIESKGTEENRRMYEGKYSINQFIALLKDAKENGFNQLEIYSDYNYQKYISFTK